ncbi:hypothetical protein GCM10007859_27590 [Brevundimonas denitrificans]|uniref:Uncharacterized protein n=1 Tax=Brevundimonas denitrificans TaxID=1443434 RepID=A0ABQ6BL89_9CAUL|nr:hypothetical protein [Brevundimonas denitrificans]GLS02728.1 hypothetical protein GCM10007859_27590 [Brevundimonas denitrificans]
MSKPFLQKGNGHQIANRRKALEFVRVHVEGLEVLNENTIRLEPYGVCHFSAYTDDVGAMISTPNRGDDTFGSADWHSRGRIMMFRDFGDGRVMFYICPIKPLFELRTIGHHGVRWPAVQDVAEMKQVFRA